MSDDKKTPTIIEYFNNLTDPRIERCRRHNLVDIIFIAVCAVICGADSFAEMEDFGLEKQDWLAQFIALPNGIPSHDTFNRVFARLKPGEFQRCFMNWIRAVTKTTDGEIVPVDGKTLRRSHNRSAGQQAIELVSAWAASNRLTLGQVKVEASSNEIKAVPQLLRLLELTGCIVTVDALNCQKEIASEIRAQEADYVLALKGNHGLIHQDVVSFLGAVREDHTYGFTISTHKEVDGEHGRIETRQYWQVNTPEHLNGKAEWKDLRSVGLVEATREVSGNKSTEIRYYLSSLQVDAKRFAEAVRGHWGIENSCHWILDVVFREDDSRVRVGEAAENLALVRRVALGLLQQDKTDKRGIKRKRLKAALNEDYLLKILSI
jgi:predicted transposase YbfD/YdcC